MPVGGLGAVEDGRDLRHPRARDDPRRADRTRTDADLHAVGARRDELLGALGGHDVPREDLHAVARLHLLDHADHAGRMTVGDVDDDEVGTRGHQGRGALVGVAGHADGGADRHAGLLDELDLPHLIGDREVAMDDAQSAELSERDRRARVGHRIHRRRDDRDRETELAGEPRRRGDLGREDVAAGGDEEDVVEGQAFLRELLLRAHGRAALTRASVFGGPAPRAAGAQWLPASRPTEIVLVAETVVGTHASNATRPPHTRMLRATRTTRSGRTRISVSSGRPPIRRPAARSEGTIGRARALAITCSGEPPLVGGALAPQALSV